MKKFIITLLLLLFVGGGYLVYQNYQHQHLTTWDFVPASAIAVFESQHIVEDWNLFSQQPLWKSLESNPQINQFNETLTELDSLSGKNGALQKITHGQNFLVSFHITSKNHLNWVMYFKPKEKQTGQLLRLLKQYETNQDYRYTVRAYHQIKIEQLTNKKTRKSMTFFHQDNVLIASRSSVLVEDVVRHLTDGQDNGFKKSQWGLFDIPKFNKDQGNLYLNFNTCGQTAKNFAHNQFSAQSGQLLNKLFNGLFLDLYFPADEIIGNGTVFMDSTNHQLYLNTFRDQPALTSNNIYGYIPKQTAVAYQIQVGNMALWQSKMAEYWKQNRIDPALRNQMTFRLNMTVADWLSWSTGNITLLTLDSNKPEAPNKLVLLPAKDIKIAQEKIEWLEKQHASSSGQITPTSIIEGQPIYALSWNNFPERLFGAPFEGFDKVFYTFYDKLLVIGNSTMALHQFINAQQLENTWGKSVRHEPFLGQTNEHSQVSLMIDFKKAWGLIKANASDPMKTFIDQHYIDFMPMDLSAIQFQRQENNSFTANWLLKQKMGATGTTKPQQLRLHSSFKVSHKPTAKPLVVKHWQKKTPEVLLLQDSSRVELINQQGASVWNTQLKDTICDEQYQIDFYNNQYLQYLIPAKNKLYLIDRNGHEVKDYPKAYPANSKVAHFSVFDYDQNKKYRFCFTSTTGDLYLTDKDLQPLKGWAPKKLGATELGKPQFFRVGSRDCILVTSKTGKVFLMNRRGAFYKGFPLDLGREFDGKIFIDEGTSLSNTKVSVISNEGLLITFDLEGKILKKNQLYKPLKESRFTLIPDLQRSDFLILRHDLHQVSFLNDNGRLLFEKDYLNPEAMDIQYYNFSKNSQFIVYTDKTQDFTYLYNQKGELLNGQPIDSSEPIALMYSAAQQKFTLYNVYRNELRQWEFYKTDNL
ncbi:hypothetical protein [Persicobacter psychrovividus]|uniref:hypothetical protein n=1 Tax=Persicobacter psychrovividus TaxID=387638 RepID=UPI0030CA4290